MTDQQEQPWIVKFRRKRDGKHYFYRHDGCLTARMESSMLLDEAMAKQFADAVTRHHPDFTATARKYPKKAGRPSKKSVETAIADAMRFVETTVSCKFTDSGKERNGEETGQKKAEGLL